MQGGTETIIYFAVIVAVFYFLIIRPQTKQRKEHQELIASLAVGDEVVTGGGLFGTIRTVSGDSVDVEIAPGVVVTVAKSAIARRIES